MNEFEQNSSFLRFGTWSVVLHVLFFVFVSFVHFSLDVEKPPPTVKVTFVEAPAPPEPEPQAPPMLQAQRLQPQPIQRKQVQPASQPPDISQPVEIPQVVAPPPPQRSAPPPKRRILQDNRAINSLRARELTKVASRRTPLPAATTKIDDSPSIFVPGFSTVAALQGAANRKHVVRSSLPPTTPGRARRTLRDTVGDAQTQTSVGVLRSVHPIYPRIAKKSGWEGTVLVRVTVETNGRVSKASVSRSSGHKVLDDAAVKAVKRWSFRPARDGNIPIRSVAVIPIKFSLNKQG